MVRISLGAYNTSEDVDVLVEMLERIMRNDYRSQYYYVPQSSDYRPVGYQDFVHGPAVRQPAEAIGGTESRSSAADQASCGSRT